MVVVRTFTSSQISAFTPTATAARIVYDTNLNAIRFNNATNYSNVVVAKDLNNNLSGINNVITTGTLGINTSAPSRQVEINSATGECLRLTHNDSDGSATNFVDMSVSASGSLSLTPSGGDINITTHNGSTSGLRLSGTLVTSTATELNYVDTTPGTAAATKALVVDSNRSIINLNYLETTSAAHVGTVNNDRVYPLSIVATPTTTAAAGLATGLEFDLTNSASEVFPAGFISCISSDVTQGSEDAFIEYRLVNAGEMDTVMTVSNTGVLTATVLVETSDVRVKENIKQLPAIESLDKIMQLDIKTYNYTFDEEKKKHTGVIAQEIIDVLPEVVDVSSKNGIEDFHSVHYTGIIPHLINAIKVLKEEIDILKGKQ